MSARHHAVISGTGRAGTTFLVRFLSKCGVDAGAVDNETATRDLGHARAGLEHNLLDPNAPYLVKDPWLFTYCDEVDMSAVHIDALIVPVRELLASATSRVFQERIAIAQTAARHREPSEVRGAVDGGIIYSLDPVDEARILAVGFHRVVRWATVHEMPLFLIDFPRAVTDGEYLIDRLAPWLTQFCDLETARAAFAASADPSAVRFTPDAGEPAGTSDTTTTTATTAAPVPSPAELDRRAFAALLDARDAELHGSREALEAAQAVLATAAHDKRTRDELEARLAGADSVIADLSARLAAACAERDDILHSTSWQVTKPLRAITKRRGR